MIILSPMGKQRGLNHILKDVLCACVSKRPSVWERYLPMVGYKPNPGYSLMGDGLYTPEMHGSVGMELCIHKVLDEITDIMYNIFCLIEPLSHRHC